MNNETDNKSLHLENVMFEIVSAALEKILPVEAKCHCERCRLDTLALALNMLPTKYIVCETGYVMQRHYLSSAQNTAEVYEAIYRAVGIVNKSPHH